VLDDEAIVESLLDGKEVQLPSPGVRRKYFSMPPMTLEQARQQLDLIDHDFYLFRDSASGDLQVIYRRNHGGYGVIEARD
jgi:putative sigma-54 modulation protein